MKKLTKRCMASALTMLVAAPMAFAAPVNQSNIVNTMNTFNPGDNVSSYLIDNNFQHLADSQGLSDYNASSNVQVLFAHDGPSLLDDINHKAKAGHHVIIVLAPNTYDIKVNIGDTKLKSISLYGNALTHPIINLSGPEGKLNLFGGTVKNIDIKGEDARINTVSITGPATITNSNISTSLTFNNTVNTLAHLNNITFKTDQPNLILSTTTYAIIKNSEFDGKTKVDLSGSHVYAVNSFQQEADGSIRKVEHVAPVK